MPTLDEVFALAWKHQQAGDPAGAEHLYREILQADPESARTWFVLGTACQAQKKAGEAEASFRQAARLRPQEAEAYYYLGSALLEQGKQEEAAVNYRHCLQLKPDHAEAMTNLGYVLSEQGQAEEARALYERAVQLKPHYAEVHHNLGNILREQGKLQEAATCYRRALELKPDYVKVLINLGVSLVALGRAAEAVALVDRALQLEPDSHEAYNVLGSARSTLGDYEGAVAAYQKALEYKPDYPDANWNLGLVLLLQGNFAQGWSKYEWRWKCKNGPARSRFVQPVWDGSPLDGKTILVEEEQGLGDTLQFIRYARLLKERGGKVIVHCPRGLTQILKRCPGIEGMVEKGASPPDFAVWAPLLSLPAIFGTTAATIPDKVPYLFADPELVEHWRQKLAPVSGFRIAIAWQGNPGHPWDRHRSIPLAAFEPLARIAGLRLVSVQVGPGTEQLQTVAGRFSVLAPGGQVIEAAGRLMETAAILKNVDLVVTVDSAVAHLAGALGVPVWVALCFTPDWRWMLDREDSPWYTSMRLFRQKKLSDWAGVFNVMATALRERVGQGPPIVPVDVALGGRLRKIPASEMSRYDLTGGVAEWNEIPGWFDLAKAIAIQQVVKCLSPGSRLVELGSFQGRSSVAIATVLPADSILFCVDHFQGSEEHRHMNLDPANLQASFMGNLERFRVKDKVRVLAMSTAHAAGHFTPASLDLILLDAAHDQESVRADLQDWYPKLKPGGFLFCDDYHPNWPGVAQAIEALGLSGQLVAPALWLHQKPL